MDHAPSSESLSGPAPFRRPTPAAPRALELVETPPSVRAQQLYEEAKVAALEHLTRLEAAMEDLRELADAVIDGGELYSPGVHDFARQLSEELLWKTKTFQALAQRQGETVSPTPRR